MLDGETNLGRARDELARGIGEESARRETEGERKLERKNKREREKERENETGGRSKEREEESPVRVEAADGQTLRDPQASVFELRPLCRLPCYYGREKGWKKWITSVRGGKAGWTKRE